MNWILVSEKLPPKTRGTISNQCLTSDGKRVCLGWYDYHFKDWSLFTIPLQQGCGKVTHWKPIIPPEEAT